MEESFVRESVIIFDQIPSNQKPQEDDFATEIVDRYKGTADTTSDADDLLSFLDHLLCIPSTFDSMNSPK